MCPFPSLPSPYWFPTPSSVLHTPLPHTPRSKPKSEKSSTVNTPNRRDISWKWRISVIEQYRDFNGIEEKGEENLIPEGNEVLGLGKLVKEVGCSVKDRARKIW
ncbi:hypothetical protein RHGRI_004399 [Rhododendron griersonianum]|uniref:Uncharacterized protein n=1 Tax=Rhododendron griersonianum TaxID=479676 RepID=A0AAV6L8R6_9ERIC|nr:hypothetical protein RHGRI_004399 [Rhododendron griersonianum]